VTIDRQQNQLCVYFSTISLSDRSAVAFFLHHL